MIEQNLTNINLLGLIITFSMCLLIIIAPRKYAPIPFLIAICYIPLGQRIVVAGLVFSAARIVILFGWIRLILKREVRSIKYNAIDMALVWWIIVSVITYTILWQTSRAFFYRMGLAYNAFGAYFLFRFLIRDYDDVVRIFKCLAVIIVPLSIAALVESSTGRNVFSIFDGVREFTPTRDGRARATFSFGNAILAGTFGATLMPLFAGMWLGKISRKLAFCGVAASAIITVSSRSSGPVMAFLLETLAFMMWPLRRRLRPIRWGLLTGLLALHIIMKAPVWALIGRISELVGGHGYDRVDLINAAINYLGDWWLIGTKYTANWDSNILLIEPNMVDMTNQFIAIGVEGGLISMSLFIAMIVYSFRGIGRAMRANERQAKCLRIGLWSMGVALLGHIVSFISVSYFTQLAIIWYMFLAMISTCEGIFYLDRRPATKVLVWDY